MLTHFQGIGQSYNLVIDEEFEKSSWSKNVLKLDHPEKVSDISSFYAARERGDLTSNEFPSLHLPLGYQPAWYYFQLENKGQKTAEIVVELNNFWIENIIAYVGTKEENTSYFLGNKFGFYGKEVPHRLALLPVTLASDEKVDVIIESFGGSQNASADLKVYSKESFERKDRKATIYTSVLWAINTLLLLIAILVNIFHKGNLYKYYLLYAVLVWGLVSGIVKIPYQYVYPSWGGFASIEVMICSLASSFSLLLLCAFYFEDSRLSDRIRAHHYKILILGIFIIGTKVMQPLLFQSEVLKFLVIPMSLIVSGVIIVCLVIVFQALIRNQSLDGFLFLAVLLLYLAIAVLSVLINQNILGVYIDTPLWFALSSLLEVGIITYLFVRHLQFLRIERDLLGDKVRNLESKVELKELKHSRLSLGSEKFRIDTDHNSFIESVEKEILKNISNSGLEVEDLASKFHLSRSQFYRKIKAETNRSVVEYIRFIRLKEGSRMIRESEEKISEIAYKLGFNDPAYFSRSFKKEFGISPQECREGRTFC